MSLLIPLSHCAEESLGALAHATGSQALTALDGQTLLGERAMLAGLSVPLRTSAGGGCRLIDARDDTIALNLARAEDRELLPALFSSDTLDPHDDEAIAACVARLHAATLVARGRMLGLAIAAENERLPGRPAPCVELVTTRSARAPWRRPPRVVDLSALWAGPLAAHLLWLAGAEVIKVESRTRPDAMRSGQPDFFALLNQGKASVLCDLTSPVERRALTGLLADADIVIEAARPRALEQLGIDAAKLVHDTPGLTWVTITAHGACGEPANWVGFGDDCAVAGGASAALRAATGASGFVGDALADPLTGIHAALIAWRAWQSGRGGRFGLAMSHIVAACIARERERDADGFERALRAWRAAAGTAFPQVARRPIGPVAPLGAHTQEYLGEYLGQVSAC